MYMNKTKRNLILASAIINLISNCATLAISILFAVRPDILQMLATNYFISLPTSSLIINIIIVAAGVVGSVLLFYSIRSKGKYFRSSHGIYIAGFIIIVVCGGFLPWILLFISMFVPDIIVMNRPSEVKKEEKVEERFYQDKKDKIESLKKLRDEGVITEEEYKQRLFELL
ncbi:MAG: SHOCT domain-containing protein [Clostridiales bacterium]|nr:SHOCT domain-containing protein [Clostridiales bacterium]